jgi:signal transduction histidine kinase
VERLTALSERYLSVARRKPPRVEPEDVGQVCRDALDFMRADLERHGIAVELDLESDLVQVSIDEGQIRQALYNLIRNAREAMQGGGRLRLAAKSAEGDVTISVEDEGPGIDPETLSHIFEPFFTTKGHGTGLGLVITREIVEAHGGRLECSPVVPKGTRFTMFLPSD